MPFDNPSLNLLADIPCTPDLRCPLQDNRLEDDELLCVLSSSLHALQLFHQRINEDAADSPRRNIVSLGRECNYLPPVGLPQLVVGNATVKLCSVVMMERSTILYL